MDAIVIIRVVVKDIDRLQSISRQTFYETFSGENTQENMEKYLGENFAAARLLQELQDPLFEFYFAVSGNRILGYLKVNCGASQTEHPSGDCVELERIYVLKEYQNHHIGTLLLQKAMEIAQRERAQYIWLGVWEHNTKAANFYERNGFVAFGKHVFTLGEEKQTDIMMRREVPLP